MTGFFRRWTPDVIVSLNELEFTVRKAVRGAGYHWGEAEEAGKAAVWLARQGLPVAEPLLIVLRAAKQDPAALRPNLENTHVKSAGPLCPLLTGILIADGAISLDTGTQITCERLLSPVLLLPFLALAAAGGERFIVLEWPGGSATAGADDTQAMLLPAPSDRPVTATLSITTAAGMGTSPLVARRVLDVGAAAWEALNAFAAETYVPATSRSRLAGAGAGLADND